MTNGVRRVSQVFSFAMEHGDLTDALFPDAHTVCRIEATDQESEALGEARAHIYRSVRDLLLAVDSAITAIPKLKKILDQKQLRASTVEQNWWFERHVRGVGKGLWLVVSLRKCEPQRTAYSLCVRLWYRAGERELIDRVPELATRETQENSVVLTNIDVSRVGTTFAVIADTAAEEAKACLLALEAKANH